MSNAIIFSIETQIDRIEAIFSTEIASIESSRNDASKLSSLLARLSYGANTRRYYILLPYFFILKQDFSMAWIVFCYFGLGFNSYVDAYHVHGKRELENPVDWDMKPLWGKDDEDKKLLPALTATSFRLVVGDYSSGLNRLIMVGDNPKAPYDLSFDGRGRTIAGKKNYYLSPDSFYKTARYMEICFRQEKDEESRECLFRLRSMSSGIAPSKHLIEHPDTTMMSAWTNVYDFWYLARNASDILRRKEYAWTALYWFLELAIRLSNSSKLDTLVDCALGCEIIGEFRLMEGEQDNFLRHLKRFVMQASISHCREMMESNITIVPFTERGMPDYETFQEVLRAHYESR